MSLRSRLIGLSLLTLLLPWSGWKLLQELERFLRESQEAALLGAARTVSSTLPFDAMSRLRFASSRYAVVRTLEREPELDGHADDWPDPGRLVEWTVPGSRLTFGLIAGRAERGSFLFVSATGAGAVPPAGFTLFVRSPRGLQRYAVEPEAPGPFQLRADGGGGQVEGFLRDTSDGYRVELALPALGRDTDLRLVPAGDQSAAADGWISIVSPWTDLAGLLDAAAPDAGRAWLVDARGWVLAASHPPPGVTGHRSASPRTTWLQRFWYRLVAADRTDMEPTRNPDISRMDGIAVRSALAGQAGAHWSQDPDSAVVSLEVAAPIHIDGRVGGAVVLLSTADGLLLVTNRALGRLLLITLVFTFGLAGGLWWFASRLSRRVRRLGGAVSAAMTQGIGGGELPLTSDRDELGELARNNQKLLRAVADYNQYLQTLAGRLSHELKTPLAITRSSLENLSNRSLDRESRQFLQRAQEGLERQTAIVRAMSEASRLEAAIGVAEWEHADLAALVKNCAAGYRDVHPGRQIEARVPDHPLAAECAPELLAQALDKLVDNAVSMTGDAERIELVLTDDDGECRLAVRNTGTALPDALRERLFDSLVSVRERRGTAPHLGLGLYIVRLVATAHGGTAHARNLPGGAGVEFEIRFPLRDRPA